MPRTGAASPPVVVEKGNRNGNRVDLAPAETEVCQRPKGRVRTLGGGIPREGMMRTINDENFHLWSGASVSEARPVIGRYLGLCICRRPH